MNTEAHGQAMQREKEALDGLYHELMKMNDVVKKSLRIWENATRPPIYPRLRRRMKGGRKFPR